MIRDNQRYFNRLHVVFDALVIALSYVSAWFLKFSGPCLKPLSGYFLLNSICQRCFSLYLDF